MKIRTLTLAAGLLIGGGVLADAEDYQWARVVDVEPIERVEHTPVDREVCYEEVRHVRPRRHGHASTVVGAIVGGVIGNQFGSGSGRDAATAAGALLGGAIAHDAARHRDENRYPVARQRCDLERSWRQRTVHDGYRVTYEYAGRLHRTTMPYRPGERIRVEVSVRPAG
jgi:uncharacterized protein YcfJ